MTFGGLLLKKRRELKLTQVEVGELIGHSNTSLHHWENNMSVPKGKHLNDLLAFYEINPEEYKGIFMNNPKLIHIVCPPISLANVIKAKREEMGLTLKEASERMGYYKSQLWNWEQGKIEPREDNIKVLADFYKLAI